MHLPRPGAAERPSEDEGTEMRVGTHACYYSAVGKDEIVPLVTTRTDLKLLRSVEEEKDTPMASLTCGI